MNKHEFLADAGILIIKPDTSLISHDFVMLTTIVDPYIHEHGKLNGPVIHAESFPGWQGFASRHAHFQYVKDHHALICKFAAVADEGTIADLPLFADRFV